MYKSADASLGGPGMAHRAPGLTQANGFVLTTNFMQMHVTFMFYSGYLLKLLRSVTFCVM
jgi:hypothetical protein